MTEPRLLGGENTAGRIVYPDGTEEPFGIWVEPNQDPDCFSIRSINDDGSEDLIHFCDWPAMKAAIDAFQGERGGQVLWRCGETAITTPS
jgi:hypothetical protein